MKRKSKLKETGIFIGHDITWKERGARDLIVGKGERLRTRGIEGTNRS